MYLGTEIGMRLSYGKLDHWVSSRILGLDFGQGVDILERLSGRNADYETVKASFPDLLRCFTPDMPSFRYLISFRKGKSKVKNL